MGSSATPQTKSTLDLLPVITVRGSATSLLTRSLSYVRRLKRFSSVTAKILDSGSTATSANTGNRSRTWRSGARLPLSCEKRRSAAGPARTNSETIKNFRRCVRMSRYFSRGLHGLRGFNGLNPRNPCNPRLKYLLMRTHLRKFFIVSLFVLAGPAALLLFSQLSGNLAPLRQVRDLFPVFADVAVDPESNILAVTDENLFSLRTYDRDLVSNDVADPRTVITGNRSRVDFVCGVAIDPTNKEIYAVNNDTAADMVVFKYDARGNVPASRTLRAAPVSTWGVALDLAHDEVAVTVEQTNKVAIYRRLAEADEKPLRIIQGPGTGLADPHGIFVDAQNNEIFVANHDSYHDAQASQEESSSVQDQFARGIADLSIPTERLQPRSSKGKFVEPSITIYS